MSYEQKYLKYKNKYISLKNQLGGEETVTPEELKGREPSLQILHDFVNGHPELLVGVNIVVIQLYFDDTTRTGKYYLGGEIPIGINDRITQELLKTVDTKHKNIDWDECSHHIERMVVLGHISSFDNLNKIIKIYYDYMIHELYRPPNEDDPTDQGGEMYLKIKEKTNIGKK